MAGDKNIYVVYDPKIEDSSSLSKFLGIVLEKANYPIKDVEFITLQNYIKLLETKGPRNFTICLNKTYSDISLKYGALLEEATFKFFSRFYQNPEKQIAILGLLMDITTLFSDENSKKGAWSKLVTFQKFYEDHKKGMQNTNISQDDEYLALTEVQELFDEDVPEVIQDSTPPVEVPLKKEVEAPVASKKVLSIRDAISPAEQNPSYETLLEFYKLTHKVLKGLDDLKQLDQKLSSCL